MSIKAAIALASCTALLLLFGHLFRCPSHLHHIPQVPLRLLILSFLLGESEDIRIHEVILPFARSCSTDIVVVWALGSWYVHVLNYKLAKELMDNKSIRKQQPNEDMLFWRFTGRHNIFFVEGDEWWKHSSIVRALLHGNIPIDMFCALGRTLLSLLGQGGSFFWSDISHRITLDAVGIAVMGHNFNAFEHPESSFVQIYRRVMKDISHPLYVAFPALERLFPCRDVIQRMNSLVSLFLGILEEKKGRPGNDFITYLLQTPGMTEAEYRDSIVILFMAGHDTTAGALSSLIFYFAFFPSYQAHARDEVISVLGTDTDPNIPDFEKMPFLQACIQESMRINSPSTVTIPRVSAETIHIGGYPLPSGVPIVLNIHAVLHNSQTWEDPDVFKPEHFINGISDEAKWMSFGVGPRQCPARNFALYELRTLSCMLLREYRWTLPEKSIHSSGRLKNWFSAFALNLPYDLYIDFTRTKT
ncbi:cytochrome P450 [Armillaria solidipes]|uniref:Cytochrome P450 n=1 Tax=Armillaria solidipes TaxID=1076256 RepID=A0A2H3B595_9AGAR|nr:cytochrome P450 [Armillaria solidipes]